MAYVDIQQVNNKITGRIIYIILIQLAGVI